MKITTLSHLFKAKYGLEELRKLLTRWEARGRVASQDAVQDLQDFLESAGINFVALDEARSEREAKVSGAHALNDAARNVLSSARDVIDRMILKMEAKISRLEAKIAAIHNRISYKVNETKGKADAKATELQMEAVKLNSEAAELNGIIDLLS